MVENTVCIILVNYNGYQDTLECVKSIKGSKTCNQKIIIVENASQDRNRIKTDEYLTENTDVIISSENLGFAGGNNLGIDYAMKTYNPQYILLLNNDTVIEPNAIEELISTANRNNKVGIVTGKINYYSEKKKFWAACGKFDFRTGIADQPQMGMIDNGEYDIECEISFASGCVMLIPNYIIKTIGKLDEKYFMYAEDTDYCCRVLREGYKIYYNGKSLIYHKVSASAGVHSVNQQYYMFRNNCYIIKKYCEHPTYGYLRRWYRTIKELLRGEYQIKQLIIAWRDFKKGKIGKRD